VSFSTLRYAPTCYEDRFAQCKRERQPKRQPKRLRAPRSNPASLRTSSGDPPSPGPALCVGRSISVPGRRSVRSRHRHRPRDAQDKPSWPYGPTADSAGASIHGNYHSDEWEGGFDEPFALGKSTSARCSHRLSLGALIGMVFAWMRSP